MARTMFQVLVRQVLGPPAQLRDRPGGHACRPGEPAAERCGTHARQLHSLGPVVGPPELPSDARPQTGQGSVRQGPHCLGDHVDCQGPHDTHVGVHLTGRRRHEGVAVVVCVNWEQRPGQPVVAPLVLRGGRPSCRVGVVATTPIVVLTKPVPVTRAPATSWAPARSSAVRSSAPGVPVALTATRAATRRPPPSAPAETNPPGRRSPAGPSLATVAPAPAPTELSGTGPSVAPTHAA